MGQFKTKRWGLFMRNIHQTIARGVHADDPVVCIIIISMNELISFTRLADHLVDFTTDEIILIIDPFLTVAVVSSHQHLTALDQGFHITHDVIAVVAGIGICLTLGVLVSCGTYPFPCGSGILVWEERLIINGSRDLRRLTCTQECIYQ